MRIDVLKTRGPRAYSVSAAASTPYLIASASPRCGRLSARVGSGVQARASVTQEVQEAQASEEGPLYTRITDTPAKCPFAGTKSFSTKETDYQSWKEGPFDLKTGLQPLPDARDLFEIDEHYVEEMEERRQLFERMHGEVFASTSEAEDADQELLDLMLEILPERYPDRFRRVGAAIHNIATGESFNLRTTEFPALEIAARLVQEDLALLKYDAKSKQYKLVSAAVLFPMRWSLKQKMNKRLNVIHGPVPFYQKNLRDPVNAFMEDLTPETPQWRANFGVTDIPYLFQALTEKDMFDAKNDKLDLVKKGHITLEDAPDRLFVRCERQTLSKMPKSGAVLFTIRTYVRPLREYLHKDKAILRRLHSALENMPEVWVNYKLMQGCKDMALELLSKHLD